MAATSSNNTNGDGYSTPAHCTADFCLIPIGTTKPSVAAEIAQVARLMKASGLEYHMHSSGTTIGSWDKVTRLIGQAHQMLHQTGVVRIHSDMRIGTRTDKLQSYKDKVKIVEDLLAKD